MIGKASLITLLLNIYPFVKSQIDAGTWQTKCINLQQQTYDPKNIHYPVVSSLNDIELLQSVLLQLPVELF